MTRVPKIIRQQVRERAKGRCEYCRFSNQYSSNHFHVDHIIPIKRHDGSPEIDNMAWACPHCNHAKETDIAAYDHDTGILKPLFNPRTQQWAEHFQMGNDAVISSMSSVGRVVRLLEMNSPLVVEVRRTMVELGLW